MRKPVIGITTSYNASGSICMRPAYVEAIRENGGIPCLLSRPTEPDALRALAADLDGLLFAGGDDVDPAYYGETVSHPSVEITPERDVFELALFAEFLKTKKPIFGICRGIQLLNVALGGSLHQHIEGHRQSPIPGSTATQHVRLSPDSRIAALCGCGEMLVNTFHHQAVKRLGNGAVATAVADDGTVEAIELPSHPFFLAVQWHPELFYAAHAEANVLFSALVAAAQRAMGE